MKILVDLNLTPQWVGLLKSNGFEAQHWSALGNPAATDRQIMTFAQTNGFVLFTHDLDFGNILAATNAPGPSVVQVRTHDPTPITIGDLVLRVLRQEEPRLLRGVLITIEPDRMRSRVLPLFSTSSE